jgi:iron complex transport system ATP-binding protein
MKSPSPSPKIPGSRDPAVALRLSDVTVWERDARADRRHSILQNVSWYVAGGEQWAMLGPNGAGKSTLLDIAAGIRHPSRGRVWILGREVGRVDLRALRERIGHVDVKTEERFVPRCTAREIVLTGATGTLRLLEDRIDDADHRRADALLRQFRCEAVAAHPFCACSQGERRRILIARALMRRPPLLLLDEPTDGLDLPGREALLEAVASLRSERPRPAVVTVTHHLEELPPSTTHAVLLRGGAVVARGPVAEVLTEGALSACFGVPVRVTRRGGRWSAASAASW